jgi:hypothetical protein
VHITHTVFEPVALPLHRLPKQTLHHVWAPKLRRPVLLTSQGQLHLWAMLEANPSVTRYCERPSWPAECGLRPALDFWALHDHQPVWLVSEELPSALPDQDACQRQEIVVQSVTAKDMDSHRVWIQNWLSLLPYLSAVSSLNLDHLGRQVVEFFTRESSFDDAERHFARDDGVLVRTAVIAQFHAGRLYSSDLLTRPWDLDTRVVRLSSQSCHAPQ